MLDMVIEKWIAINGFSNYEISTFGRIRSINPRKGSRANIDGGIIDGWVQTITAKNRFYQRKMVSLRKDNKSFIYKVHRLVLENYIGQCPDGMVTRHLDGNSLNNRLSNLVWGTQCDNVQDSITHGTKTNPPIHHGETHHNAIISYEDVKLIREMTFKKGDIKNLAKHYGVNPITITRIRTYQSRING